MIANLPSVGEVTVSVHGVPDPSQGRENAFLLKAKFKDEEIGYLLVEPDRHKPNTIRFIESWTAVDFFDQGLQIQLSRLAERLTQKRLDVAEVPDRGAKPGWNSLR